MDLRVRRAFLFPDRGRFRVPRIVVGDGTCHLSRSVDPLIRSEGVLRTVTGPMQSRHSRFFVLALLCLHSASAGIVDTLVFGEEASESAHLAAGVLWDRTSGGLGEPCRRLLPGGEASWRGGSVRFSLGIDPERRNYFTLRLWGGDVNRNQLTLHVAGKQIGYRHLGDIEALEIGTDAAAYPGRFHYRTCPLPLELTKGKDRIECEIRATGPIWGYGRTFDDYQQPMTEPTRGIYRAYSHTDACFTPPAAEKQGAFPENPPRRTSPGPEVLDVLKKRVNAEIDSLLREPDRPCRQMHTLFLAEAWHTPWTRAAGKPETIRKISASLDALYRAYVANPKIAEAEPSTYNPDWFGLGPAGQVIMLLEKELAPSLDQRIDDGAGRQVRRRDGFAAMLRACRDWHREHRRQYTNQSMINDLYGIYLANRGLAVVAPEQAMPEARALRYLRESVGLDPWLGSEKDGQPGKPLGDSFHQTTARGLTRELGYVGNYGEVLDWVARIYEATRPAPGQPGDPAIKAQLVKIARARAPFRYPMVDAEGKRAMIMETIVGWRDTHFPGDVTYDQRPSWDGSPFEVSAATLDPHLVGYSQQMLEDQQFFAGIARQVESPGFRTTFGLMGVPERYEAIRAQPPSPHRLPMSWDQPDFVFADEENGVGGAQERPGDPLRVSLLARPPRGELPRSGPLPHAADRPGGDGGARHAVHAFGDGIHPAGMDQLRLRERRPPLPGGVRVGPCRRKAADRQGSRGGSVPGGAGESVGRPRGSLSVTIWFVLHRDEHGRGGNLRPRRSPSRREDPRSGHRAGDRSRRRGEARAALHDGVASAVSRRCGRIAGFSPTGPPRRRRRSNRSACR